MFLRNVEGDDGLEVGNRLLELVGVGSLLDEEVCFFRRGGG
jgi:hypothetical protein